MFAIIECYLLMLMCQKMIKILCPMLVLVVHCVLQNVLITDNIIVYGEREVEGIGRRRVGGGEGGREEEGKCKY